MTAPVVGSLLEMVPWPRCGVHEWDEGAFRAVHGAARGIECDLQNRAVDGLAEAIRSDDQQAAHAAYVTCLRLRIIHTVEYAFTLASLAGMPYAGVYGADEHHYVGCLRADGSYGMTNERMRRLEVCACGKTFPGINPRTGIYDKPLLTDHVKDNTHESADAHDSNHEGACD